MVAGAAILKADLPLPEVAYAYSRLVTSIGRLSASILFVLIRALSGVGEDVRPVISRPCQEGLGRPGSLGGLAGSGF